MSAAGLPPDLTLGALVRDGGTRFRVWAPGHTRVSLVLFACRESPDAEAPGEIDERPLTRDRDEDGYWTGTFDDVAPGALYKFRLDGGDPYPDPASRFQPFGVHGPSQVIDPSRFAWTDAAWTPPTLETVVVYELHVGTFTPEGTFRAVITRLPYLVELGVTAIELMPVADFPGGRNWGYDGVALFAPARCYGTPDDLRALVDAAHAHGLACYLDVVYNHFGPDGAYANAYSAHYFNDAHQSPWGLAVNLDGPHSREVRRFFIENALSWIRDFHFDGLRLDATHALVDDSPRHFLEELTTTVRAGSARPVHLIAEDHRNLATMLLPRARGGYGLDAVWADDFHHQVRVHTAHDREGYYRDFTGAIDEIARTLTHGWFFTGQYSQYLNHARGTDPGPLLPRQFVVCVQNHDQIGNRADGARLNHQIAPATYRAVTVLLLLAPQTPLLFMGQEWAASSPFQFFTDHHEELGRLVTKGRRQEFKSFAAFADPAARERIPDPQAVETFARSHLRWEEREVPGHRGVLRLYQRTLALRRASPVFRTRSRDSYTVESLDAHTLAIDYGAGRLVAVIRLSGGPGQVRVPRTLEPKVLLATDTGEFAEDPQPADIVFGHDVTLAFARPGAVVLGA